MINKIMAGMLGFLFLAMGTLAAVQAVPWYRFVSPTTVSTATYYSPGDVTQVLFERTSMINMQARMVRELIRLDTQGNEYEVSSVSSWLNVDVGHKNIISNWYIPTTTVCPTMKPNTYRWRGSVTYRPFGLLEKSVPFETNTFQVRF